MNKQKLININIGLIYFVIGYITINQYHINKHFISFLSGIILMFIGSHRFVPSILDGIGYLLTKKDASRGKNE